MIYFGIEIFDGVPFSTPFPLDEDKPLQDQWSFLAEDIAFIKYSLQNGLAFIIDIGWYGSRNPDAHFRIDVFGIVGTREVFFRERVKDFSTLKNSICNAVSFIQKLKNLSLKEILELPKLQYRMTDDEDFEEYWD